MDIYIAELESKCPVCGAPFGSCAGNEDDASSVVLVPPRPIDDPHATFTVPERVYENRLNQRTGKVSKVLVYPKGARIRPEEARKLGLLP